jgi:hypothetical protein
MDDSPRPGSQPLGSDIGHTSDNNFFDVLSNIMLDPKFATEFTNFLCSAVGADTSFDLSPLDDSIGELVLADHPWPVSGGSPSPNNANVIRTSLSPDNANVIRTSLSPNNAPGEALSNNDDDEHHEFAVSQVKAYQRSSRAASAQWHSFLQSHGFSSMDPNRHSTKVLNQFLEDIEGALNCSALPTIPECSPPSPPKHKNSKTKKKKDKVMDDITFLTWYNEQEWSCMPPLHILDRYEKLNPFVSSSEFKNNKDSEPAVIASGLAGPTPTICLPPSIGLQSGCGVWPSVSPVLPPKEKKLASPQDV